VSTDSSPAPGGHATPAASPGDGDGREHDADRRIEGIPEGLPEDESVLWEGGPDVGSLSRHVFHVRKIAGYFGVLILGRAWWARDAADPLADWASGALILGAAGAAVVGFGWLMAWLVARTTTYAVTSERVAMKIGIAFPKVINLPFEEIDSASRKRYRDGTGNIALEPRDDRRRIPLFLLWPHARPWRLANPQPALRSLSEMGEVVRLVGEGLRSSAREEDTAGAETVREEDARGSETARENAGREAGRSVRAARTAAGA